MAKALSMDLRERVIAACDAGGRPEDVGPEFGVSARAVYKWLALRRATGSFAPQCGKRGPGLKLEEHREVLRQLVEQKPDAILEELRAALPISVCVSTVWVTLRRMGIVLKKSDPRLRTTAARRPSASRAVARRDAEARCGSPGVSR